MTDSKDANGEGDTPTFLRVGQPDSPDVLQHCMLTYGGSPPLGPETVFQLAPAKRPQTEQSVWGEDKNSSTFLVTMRSLSTGAFVRACGPRDGW